MSGARIVINIAMLAAIVVGILLGRLLFGLLGGG